MIAELPGAATVKVMSRLEQEETGEVFEEANGGLLEASQLLWRVRRKVLGFVSGGYSKQHLLLVGCSK